MHEHTWRRYALHYPLTFGGQEKTYLLDTDPVPPHTFYVGHDCACGEQGYSA